MDSVIKLFSLVILVILLAISKGVSSTSEPTISASPGVLPYVSAPDISSFFPNPSANQPMSSSGAPSEAEAPAPAPTSGEFDGHKISDSAMLDSAGAIVGVLLCCCAFISTIVIV